MSIIEQLLDNLIKDYLDKAKWFQKGYFVVKRAGELLVKKSEKEYQQIMPIADTHNFFYFRILDTSSQRFVETSIKTKMGKRLDSCATPPVNIRLPIRLIMAVDSLNTSELSIAESGLKALLAVNLNALIVPSQMVYLEVNGININTDESINSEINLSETQLASGKIVCGIDFLLNFEVERGCLNCDTPLIDNECLPL